MRRGTPALALGAGLAALSALAVPVCAPQEEERVPGNALHSGALGELRGVARLAWIHDWPIRRMVDRVAAGGGDISPIRRNLAAARDAWREARTALLELMDEYQEAAPPADALVQVAEQRLDSYDALDRWLAGRAPVSLYRVRSHQADAALGRAAAEMARLAQTGRPPLAAARRS